MGDPEPFQRVIVVGASAGGVEALTSLAKGMPGDLPVPVFVAVHAPPYSHSALPDILSRSGPLRATHALHGEAIEPARIYVAPPDNHLKVRLGYVEVVRGPRENGHRPAVDVLFRSAANAYGSGVIGVVLSGALDCGTAGLRAIKARGGTAVVQDPSDALFADMPSSALHYAHPDLVSTAGTMGQKLASMVTDQSGRAPGGRGEPPPARSASFVTCPACHGSMTESDADEDFTEYSCHVGHVFSLPSLVAEQAEELEGALWAAIRSFTESESLARRVARASEGDVAARFLDKAEAMKRNAKLLEALITDASGLTPVDAHVTASRAKG
jgi:two-component system chemotaxis response regulator CheB